MLPRHFSYQDKILLLQHGCTDLLQLAQRRGAQLHKLLSGTAVFEQDIQKPHGRLHHADWLKLLQNCQQQLNSPELPFLLGMALLQNRYISLSQTLLYAANLKQALSQLLYFRHQLFPGVYVQLYHQRHAVVLEFNTGIALGQQHSTVITMLFSLILSLIKHQLGNSMGISAQLRHQPPQLELPYQLHWGCAVSFNHPCDSLSIEPHLWQRAFSTANPAEFAAARRTCRQLNRILPRQRGLLEQISKMQRHALPTLISLEQAAQHLGLSASILKRQLSLHKTNFAQLIDNVRRDAARQLLQQGHYSNRQLASKLGYSDEHNFRRAFKRWTGVIPSSFKDLQNSH
ncbi:helix-turn-helix domain-containing protein [Rheinheimera aquimaris]|uniref:helix-turn-helix transcriptional regulator n=1 Tax=Rheinheimera aquimaris TaxID=412437 RepID=UPI003A97EE58